LLLTSLNILQGRTLQGIQFFDLTFDESCDREKPLLSCVCFVVSVMVWLPFWLEFPSRQPTISNNSNGMENKEIFML